MATTIFSLVRSSARLTASEELQDVRHGLVGERSDAFLEHLSRMVTELGATHVQVEQCFSFPAFERLRRLHPHLRLIYSSQNVEGPLKQATMTTLGVAPEIIAQAVSHVRSWESSTVREADLVVACSAADATVFESMGARDVVVARNGVADFPVGTISRDLQRRLRGERFLMTVGSHYPPNWDGFAKLVLNQSRRFRQPPTVVVCGGMAYRVPRLAKAHTGDNLDSNLILLPEISDAELAALKRQCHGFLLPILTGGGSNLKTAEALISGKHVIGTSVAFRGFDEFLAEPGVVIANSSPAFKDAMSRVLNQRQPVLSPQETELRQSVRWDRSLQPFFQRLAHSDDRHACSA